MKISPYHAYPFQLYGWQPLKHGLSPLPPRVESAAIAFLEGYEQDYFNDLILAVLDAAANFLPYQKVLNGPPLKRSTIAHCILMAIHPHLNNPDPMLEEEMFLFLRGRVIEGLQQLRKHKLVEVDDEPLKYCAGFIAKNKYELETQLDNDDPTVKYMLDWISDTLSEIKLKDQEDLTELDKKFKWKEFDLPKYEVSNSEKAKVYLRKKFPLSQNQAKSDELKPDPRLKNAVKLSCTEVAELCNRSRGWACTKRKKGAGFMYPPGSKSTYWYRDWLNAHTDGVKYMKLA